MLPKGDGPEPPHIRIGAEHSMATKPEDAKPAEKKSEKTADAKTNAPAPKDGAAKPAATAKPGGKKKPLVMIAAGAVLLAGGGGTAAYFLLGNKAVDAEHAEAKHDPKKIPIFVDLETFTVNLREPDDERFMQIKLVAELKDAPSGEVLKSMMPAVRNEILLTLGSKQAQDLASREGKETLAREIVAAANKSLAGTPAEKSVESVNFTHLIIQ